MSDLSFNKRFIILNIFSVFLLWVFFDDSFAYRDSKNLVLLFYMMALVFCFRKEFKQGHW